MSVNVTTELVKELRDATGISVMQCRRALIEAEGDMKKALAILKKTSSDIALKKADRVATDGAVMIKTNGAKTVLLALHCETDFVSRNEDFTNLLSSLIDLALTKGIEEMKKVAKDMIDSVIQKTGEKIELGEVYEIRGEVVGSYVHNNKIGIIVSLVGGNQELAKDIAMHVAAMKPEYITDNDINEETKKTMTEIFEKEVAKIDKPEEIKKKMLEGKINTYFKEKTLKSQPFIKNPDETVGQLLERNKAKIIEVKRYFI
ncbi:translation elongation factor Ts [Candidatus Nomurabacteria bacterium RIFCSPLOWO2_01_FULL_41_21]|uniref:Elongation factor Ts n=2 Tax=Candidatus Nomuraibacteriota TaxID=1752729 RepID=A0A1F6V201_9BACT|nr:MAG: translation elongation factor Ts [Candidatus Nomurabacteria bacterium RIFCSPHIGHO2_01_FULL_40_20]OGI88522.1 MAG: translation elongation factor Ts [Candidatus Nomurabacteria bacterium RIFCSPLOWO2_01_FULL_41_21]